MYVYMYNNNNGHLYALHTRCITALTITYKTHDKIIINKVEYTKEREHTVHRK